RLDRAIPADAGELLTGAVSPLRRVPAVVAPLPLRPLTRLQCQRVEVLRAGGRLHRPEVELAERLRSDHQYPDSRLRVPEVDRRPAVLRVESGQPGEHGTGVERLPVFHLRPV